MQLQNAFRLLYNQYNVCNCLLTILEVANEKSKFSMILFTKNIEGQVFYSFHSTRQVYFHSDISVCCKERSGLARDRSTLGGVHNSHLYLEILMKVLLTDFNDPNHDMPVCRDLDHSNLDICIESIVSLQCFIVVHCFSSHFNCLISKTSM